MKRKTAIIGALVLALSPSAALGDWQSYEETNLKGTISGTIQKGHIFQTQSGSIYEVTDLTLQLVLEIMPKVVVLQNGEQFKLIVEGFDEPLICRQLAPPTHLATRPAPRPKLKVPPEPVLDGNLPLGQLMSPAQQEEMGLHKLTNSQRERLRKFLAELYLRGIEDGKVQRIAKGPLPDSKSPTPAVIESQVDGNFEGWTGETVVKLVNGQIWQQARYHYHYHYAYRPRVTVYQAEGVYKMKVEGVDQAVVVTRIK